MEITLDKWEAFKKWIRDKKNVSIIYEPDLTSVKLWEEFNNRKKERKC